MNDLVHATIRSLTQLGFGLAILAILVALTPTTQAKQLDALSAEARWSVPEPAESYEQLNAWLSSDDVEVDDAKRQQIEQLWKPLDTLSAQQVQAKLVQSLAFVNSRAAAIVETCERPREASELTQPLTLDTSTDLPKWALNSLQLHYGTWLANHQFYDEAKSQLEPLGWEEVADPATLLFYQALVFHRRLEKDACLDRLALLLENESILPRRYAAVGKLMQADLKPLKPDSLNEISRMMDNIKVRLAHGRAGQRVRKEEQDVIEKLDKLIEQLEEQAQSSASSSSTGGAAPGKPMENSTPAGGLGDGNVDPKKLGTESEWGNLPPKEREEALQQLSKDLPSHYRTVIEEYFRKLAKDGE